MFRDLGVWGFGDLGFGGLGAEPRPCFDADCPNGTSGLCIEGCSLHVLTSVVACLPHKPPVKRRFSVWLEP